MVLVCHPHEFIHIKTHKTASTTVEMYLEPYCAPEGHQVRRNPREQTISDVGIVGARFGGRERAADQAQHYWFNHMSARRIRRQLGSDRFDRYVKVASIRNPFRRLVSAFYYLSVWRKKEFPPVDSFAEAKERFAAFMRNADDPEPHPLQAKSDYNLVHIDGECVLDHVLRVESLEEDMQGFLDSIGIEVEAVRLTKERENNKTRAEWGVMDFFEDTEMVERAHALDAWVFEKGGYSMDPAHA